LNFAEEVEQRSHRVRHGPRRKVSRNTYDAIRRALVKSQVRSQGFETQAIEHQCEVDRLRSLLKRSEKQVAAGAEAKLVAEKKAASWEVRALAAEASGRTMKLRLDSNITELAKEAKFQLNRVAPLLASIASMEQAGKQGIGRETMQELEHEEALASDLVPKMEQVDVVTQNSKQQGAVGMDVKVVQKRNHRRQPSNENDSGAFNVPSTSQQSKSKVLSLLSYSYNSRFTLHVCLMGMVSICTYPNLCSSLLFSLLKPWLRRPRKGRR
jgi:hypothetical protein